jgi:CheY-like chemotaxis protein
MSHFKYNTILLADDDEDDRSMFLEAMGSISKDSTIITATNGENMLSILEEATFFPDVIFMDLNMPVMNGLECLTKLKSFQKFNNIPIIIFTTSNNAHTISQMFKAGAALYLTKPTSFFKLSGLLSKALKKLAEFPLITIESDFVFAAV